MHFTPEETARDRDGAVHQYSMGFKLCKALWKPIITAIVNRESRYRRTFPVGVPRPQPSQGALQVPGDSREVT